MTLLTCLSLQIAALQNSEVLRAASELNFSEDMFGSFNTLLCGQQPDSNSTNTTSAFQGFGGRQNDTDSNDTLAGTGNRNSSKFCSDKRMELYTNSYNHTKGSIHSRVRLPARIKIGFLRSFSDHWLFTVWVVFSSQSVSTHLCQYCMYEQYDC